MGHRETRRSTNQPTSAKSAGMTNNKKRIAFKCPGPLTSARYPTVYSATMTPACPARPMSAPTTAIPATASSSGPILTKSDVYSHGCSGVVVSENR